MDPDVDEVVKSHIVERHVVGTTIKLVLMERYQAPMVDEVVNQQPLLEDVSKVLLRDLQSIQSRIDDL